MNNLDKLLVLSLRRKYFRAPMLKEIRITTYCKPWMVDYALRISIGSRVSNIVFKRKDIKLLQRECLIFKKHKTKQNLKRLCSIVYKDYKKLLKTSFGKGLLNKSGIIFVKELKIKLQKLLNSLEKIQNKIDYMKPFISVCNPYAKAIYNPRNNKHIRNIKWEIEVLDQLLTLNKPKEE